MKKYTVHINVMRTLDVVVEAEDEDEALDLVKEADENGEYDDHYWEYADTNYDVWEEK